MKKRIITGIVALMMTVTVFAGCGKDEQKSANLDGSCEEILNRVYEKADLDAELLDIMQSYYETVPIDETTEEYILGTNEVNYTDAVCSAPMITSVAYQCVVLRLETDEDVKTAKQLLVDNAIANKWVCVEAESVIVENVGDVILYVMADSQTANAIRTAFLALGE